MARKTGSKKENFFVNFWNGQLSLPMSYWGVGVGLGIIFGVIIGLFTGIMGMSDDAMWGFIIPFQIYTVVGIWRSSDRYKGPKFWAILAKVMIVIGIISNFGQMITGV